MQDNAEPERRGRKRREPAIVVEITLLDAAQKLLTVNGYSSITPRLSALARLKHQAVSYYFGSHKELLLALFRRQASSYYPQVGVAKDAPNLMSMRRDQPRHMTVLPGGESRVRAK